MITPGPASIFVVDFPFSDLSGSKLRPAILEDAPFAAILSAIISALQKAMPL